MPVSQTLSAQAAAADSSQNRKTVQRVHLLDIQARAQEAVESRQVEAFLVEVGTSVHHRAKDSSADCSVKQDADQAEGQVTANLKAGHRPRYTPCFAGLSFEAYQGATEGRLWQAKHLSTCHSRCIVYSPIGCSLVGPSSGHSARLSSKLLVTCPVLAVVLVHGC